ncbi:BTB/POZ domain-containing-like protein isoform 1 [Theobroma cacao]|uniref:BTB/POZ domain-containing-like protein isoform 1 n=1 Tax=Theobroma cacao TaxID=3641 RepID=A0A061FST4_THECC|nr:BTB/POZ domain-containing-like protein isoform 1 [Theobroma cacao]
MSGFHFERPSSIPFGVFSSNGTTSASGFSSPFGSFASPPANTGPSTFGFSPVGVNSGNHASSGSSLFGASTGNHASSNAASATSTFGAATARRSPSGRTNSTAPTSKNEVFDSLVKSSLVRLEFKVFWACFWVRIHFSTSIKQFTVDEPHANVNKAMSGLKDTEDDLKKKISFLSGFVVAFKEQTHTDILLKPNNGPCIPAHKALLAARSEIFKNMLDSDGCKAPPSDTDTITLSELNNEELESLLEFLYTGNLPLDKLEKHVYSLYVAADKYEIPYLQESCESYMLNSLNASNAIDILEIADAQSNKTLKETTLNFIIRNMKDIVSTTKYEVFASSNPALCMQITRAFVDAKSN